MYLTNMRMVTQSNPRSVYANGGTAVVSIPQDIRDEYDIDLEDDMVWTLEEGTLRLEHVSYTVGGSDE